MICLQELIVLADCFCFIWLVAVMCDIDAVACVRVCMVLTAPPPP